MQDQFIVAYRWEYPICTMCRVLEVAVSGLSAKPRTHRTRTTDSQLEQPVAYNLLDRDCTASELNTKWVAAITVIWTTEGWIYLAVVLDVFSRMVVGWVMDSQRDETLVEQAARIALARRQPEPGLLHLSDCGSQYTAERTGPCSQPTALW
jgi:putative transposase